MLCRYGRIANTYTNLIGDHSLSLSEVTGTNTNASNQIGGVDNHSSDGYAAQRIVRSIACLPISQFPRAPEQAFLCEFGSRPIAAISVSTTPSSTLVYGSASHSSFCIRRWSRRRPGTTRFISLAINIQ